jgi:hypothetical protein
MRSGSFVFLLALLSAASAAAVPVDPNGPSGVAAVLPLNFTIGSYYEFYVLSTGGEVWRANATGRGEVWSRQGGGFNPGELDPPMAVSEIADWWLWGFRTRAGDLWSFTLNQRWEQLPAPPFAPVGVQKKSLGSAKQGYR